MILFVQTPSIKAYQDAPERILGVERTCPQCDRALSRNGSRSRWVFSTDACIRIPLFRLRCRPCGLSFTLEPDFLIPYHRYIGSVIEYSVERYITSAASCRAIAVRLSGFELPPDQSITDALLAIPLFPSYQRIHAWVRRLGALAANYTKDFVTWLLRLKPDSLILHLLSAELPAFIFKSNSDLVRQRLRDAALLLIVLRNSPEITTPDGWLPRLNHLVLRVIGSIPWRAPPNNQGLPPSA